MTRRRWALLAAIPMLLAAGLWAAQRVDPKAASDFLIGLERHRAGLTEKRLHVDGYEVAYLDSGEREGAQTLVLIHGLGADKDHFTRVSSHFLGRYRVISLDLPGFGDSTRLPLPWDIPSQAERVKKILTALGLTRFHLGGSSMGGFIAMTYAAAHPDEVLSLWLLAPSGVGGAKQSQMFAMAEATGRSPLFARRVEDLDDVTALVFAKPPWLPWSVKHTRAEQMVRDEPLHQQIFEVVRSATPINAVAPQIKARTLIVWGAEDRVLDVSGGQALVKLLPHARLEVMPGLGHLPMLEDPRACADSYLEFLGE